MCCCNDDRPEITFVTEDGSRAEWDSWTNPVDTEYEIVSVRLNGGYANEIRFTVRPIDKGGSNDA